MYQHKFEQLFADFQAKNAELDQATKDEQVYVQTIEMLEGEKSDLIRQLESYHEDLEQKVQKLFEYEALIETMGAKMKEHEEFRDALL